MIDARRFKAANTRPCDLVRHWLAIKYGVYVALVSRVRLPIDYPVSLVALSLINMVLRPNGPPAVESALRFRSGLPLS